MQPKSLKIVFGHDSETVCEFSVHLNPKMVSAVYLTVFDAISSHSHCHLQFKDFFWNTSYMLRIKEGLYRTFLANAIRQNCTGR